MKRLMRIVLLLLFSIILVSCNGEIAITLDAPQNVAIQDGVLTWDAVTDATGYTVVVDTSTYNVTATTFDLNTLDLAVGTYPVHVIATQGTNLSLPSTTLNYVIEAVVVGIPQNVAISSGVVTWSAVTGATGYTVYVGTTPHDVTATTFNLTTLTLAQGNYTIYVVAKIGTDVSLSSTTVSYFVGGTTLAAPLNVVITAGVVTWSAVSGAGSYVVYVGDDSYPVTATTFDLTTLDLLPGNHAVFVVAKAGTDSSAASITVNYFIESANLDTLYEDALSLINPFYEPDMTVDDFTDEYEYQDYMQMSQMVYAFSVAAVEMGMTEDNALDLFGQITSTPSRMMDITNLTTLMEEIDSYGDYNLSSTDLAAILYQLAKVALSIHIDDLQAIILEDEQYITDLEADLVVAQANATLSMATVYANLILYATPEEIVQLDYFLSGQYEHSYYVLNTLSQIAWDLEYNFDFHYPYYLDDSDEYMQLFYNIFSDAAIALDYTLLDLFINGDPLSSMYDLLYTYESIKYTNEDIINREDETAMMLELQTFLVDEKDMMIDSISGVVDYLSLVYDTVPASMITLIDDLVETGELTMEEYFMLKDEVVSVLVTTLPSVEDFGSVYTTLFAIAGAFEVTAFDVYLPYAGFFGAVDHATIDIALTFVGEIDQDTVEDVMLIVDGMIIPGEYVYDEYWEEWYYEDSTVDFEKAIELAVYIGNYLDAFKTANAAKFATLDALMTSAQVEELFLLFGASVKDALLLELSPDEYAIAAMMIDEILANYDNFVAAAEIVHAVGANVVNEFLTTSGSMLLDLYDLMNNGSGDLSDPLFVAEVEAVLAQMVNYKAAFTDELDAASIEVLLSLVRIPLKVQLLMMSDLDPLDIDDLLDAAIVPLTAVLDLYITFIGYIDENVVIDIVLLANDLMIPGAYVDDGFGGYYEPDTVDFEVAVELAVYVGNYLEAFKLANVAKFDAVGALFTNGDVFDLLTIFTDLYLSQKESEMDPAQYEMISLIIDEVLANYDDIIAAFEVVGSLGMAVVDEFLATNGQMLLDLYDLVNNGSGDLTDPLFVAELEAVLAQVVDYKTSVVGVLDATSIEALLVLVKIPLKIELLLHSDLTPLEIDNLLGQGIQTVIPVLDLLVTFVGYIDEEAFMDVALLANDLVIPGAFVDDGFGGYYEPDTVDFEIAVELAVYVGNYLEAFQLANVAKFDAVGALFTDGDVFDLLTIFTDLFLSQMESEMDPAQYEMISLIIDEVLGNYDDIIAALEVVGSLGMVVVDQFLITSGQILLDLYDLVNNGSGNLADPLFVAAVESLITQALTYNTGLTGELDLASVQSLLNLVRIPLKIQILMEGTMESAAADLMLDALMIPASTIILNAITLEKALFLAVDNLDLATLLPTWNIIDQDAAMALVVLALDDTLTFLNEALVFATISIVRNDILKNADIMVLMATTAVDVDTMMDEVVSNLTTLFAEIHVVAQLDFTTMDQVDIDQLHALFEMVMPAEEPPLT